MWSTTGLDNWAPTFLLYVNDIINVSNVLFPICLRMIQMSLLMAIISLICVIL